MGKEVILITVSCVLFIQMGLSDAIQEFVGLKSKIFSCVKCLSFWTNLSYLVFTKHCLLLSVSISFLASYCALWMALLYDGLASLYNWIYEKLSSTEHAESDEDAEDEESEESDPDEVL